MKLISTLKRLAVGALALLGAQSAFADDTEFECEYELTDGCSRTITAKFRCYKPGTITGWGYCELTGFSKLLTSPFDITIPESIKVTDQEDASRNVTYRVLSIADNAFTKSGYGDMVQNVTVDARLKSVGSEAFKNCTYLKTVTFNLTGTADEGRSGRTTLGWSCFAGCTGLVSIDMSKLIMPILGECYTTGASSSSDFSYLFSGCTNLSTVKFPRGLTIIPGYAFYNCKALKNLSIPEGVKTIRRYAFAGSGIKNLILPSTIIGGRKETTFDEYTMGSQIFDGCETPINVRFLSTDPSIVDIEQGDRGPWYLTRSNVVIYHSATARLGEESYKESHSNCVDPNYYIFAVHKSSTTNARIDDEALKTIKVSSDKTESAFLPDELLTEEEKALKDSGAVIYLRKAPDAANNKMAVTITPESSQIWYMFQTMKGSNVANYTQGTGTSAKHYIDKEKITGDIMLVADANVEFDYKNVHYRINETCGLMSNDPDKKPMRTVIATGLASTIKDNGKNRRIVIEDIAVDPQGNEYVVTDIAERAFRNTDILSIDMSAAEHLSVLRYATFAGCTTLNKVAFPPSLNTIMKSCFYGCTSFNGSLNLPEGSVAYLALPEGLNYIDESAFYRTKLTRVLIPSTVLRIGRRAFRYSDGSTDESENPTADNALMRFRFMGATLPELYDQDDTEDGGGNPFHFPMKDGEYSAVFYAQAEHRAVYEQNDWWMGRSTAKNVRYVYNIDTKILPVENTDNPNPLGLDIALNSSDMVVMNMVSELDPKTHTYNCAVFTPGAANNKARISWTANKTSKGDMSLIVSSMGDNNNHVSKAANVADFSGSSKQTTSKFEDGLDIYGDVLLTLSGAPTYRVTVCDPNSKMLVARRVPEGSQVPVLVSLDEKYREGYTLEDIRNKKTGESILGNGVQGAPVRKAAAASATPTGEYANDYYFLSEPITEDTQYDIIWKTVTTQAPQAVAERIEGVRVYPATMCIHIEGLDGIDVDADVIDSNGRVLYTGQERVIEVPAAGVYLVRVAGTIYKLAVN